MYGVYFVCTCRRKLRVFPICGPKSNPKNKNNVHNVCLKGSKGVKLNEERAKSKNIEPHHKKKMGKKVQRGYSLNGENPELLESLVSDGESVDRPPLQTMGISRNLYNVLVMAFSFLMLFVAFQVCFSFNHFPTLPMCLSHCTWPESANMRRGRTTAPVPPLPCAAECTTATPLPSLSISP